MSWVGNVGVHKQIRKSRHLAPSLDSMRQADLVLGKPWLEAMTLAFVKSGSRKTQKNYYVALTAVVQWHCSGQMNAIFILCIQWM